MGIKTYIIVGLVVVALVATCGILRNANKLIHPKKPRIVTLGPYRVLSVSGGACLIVEGGRRGREVPVLLANCEAPPLEADFGIRSAKQLTALAGGSITIRYEKRRIFSSGQANLPAAVSSAVEDSEDGENGDTVSIDDFDYEELAKGKKELGVGYAAIRGRRGVLTGVVFGATGINLNLAQLTGGWADCGPDAPADYRKAKADAQKNKRGIWAKK
jgi:hypothetical protein